MPGAEGKSTQIVSHGTDRFLDSVEGKPLNREGEWRGGKPRATRDS